MDCVEAGEDGTWVFAGEEGTRVDAGEDAPMYGGDPTRVDAGEDGAKGSCSLWPGKWAPNLSAIRLIIKEVIQRSYVKCERKKGAQLHITGGPLFSKDRDDQSTANIGPLSGGIISSRD